MDNYIRIIILLLLSFRLSGQSTETTSAFDVNSTQPIDTRLVINEFSDTISINYLYKGLITYILDLDKYYYYDGTNWVQMYVGAGGELPPTLDYLDFTNNIGDQSYLEGRIYYDTTNHTLTFFDDEPESSLQIGQEQRVRVYNGNGSTITNGYAVSVTGLTADGVLEVGLAIASDKESALNTIGIATHDIEAGTYGWATTHGIVRDVNTSSITGGAAIYLSDSIAGWYTTERPPSPSYEVRMGGVVQQDITEGQLYAELRIITNTHDNFNFFTGAILESNSATITAIGGVVTSVLSNTEGGDSINLIFDDGYLRVPSGISVNLTLGTDTVPVENFVYITDEGVMTTSTSSFPLAGDYVPLGRYVVPSAARAEAYGVYKSHAYTDHLRGGSNGHLSHINQWIRSRPAEWQSGVVLTTSAAVGVATDTIDLSFTSGVVLQLHNQTFPAFDTETDASFVVNDFATPYEIIEGITPSIDTDSEGNAIGNNKYYNIVIWGVASQEAKDCKIFYNLPSGSYTSEADALNDLDDYTSFSIPSQYTGTGFLISKLTIQRTNTTVKIIDITDLRGSIPIAGGGATAGGQGITSFDELTDSPASKAGAAGYHVKVNGTENALEYVAPETNFYDDNDTLSDNRTVYMDSKGLTLLNGSGFILQGLDVIHTGDYTLAGSTEYPFFIGGNYSGMMELSRSGFTGADIKLSNFTDSWVFGMDDNEGFFVKDNDASTTPIYIANGGASVGIGTTTPSAKLHIQGVDPEIMLSNSSQPADDQDWSIRLDGDDFSIYNYNDIDGVPVLSVNYLNIDQNGNLSTTANYTTQGNVGIGTTTPSAKLEVIGEDLALDARIDNIGLQTISSDYNAQNSFIGFNSYYDGTSRALKDGASSSIQSANGRLFFRTSGYAQKDSTAENITRMYIDTTGNVGIGTTAPGSELHVSKVNASGTTAIKISNDTGTANSYAALKLGQSPESSGVSKSAIIHERGATYGVGEMHFAINDATDATEVSVSDAAMTIYRNGNVGIGTTTPEVELNVEWTGASGGARFKRTDFGTNGSDVFLNGSGGDPQIRFNRNGDSWAIGNDGGKFAIDDNANLGTNNRLTIDASGNVGIGTSTPSEKLHVNGNARFQSIGSGTSSGALHYEADGTLTTNTSDRRLKKNIVEVNDSIALVKLLELKPSEFKWKQSKKVMRDSSFIDERKQSIIELTMQIDSLEGTNTGSGTSIPNQIEELTQQRKTAKQELKQYRKINKKRKENTDRINIGFIAQDVRKVLPSAVGKNDDGYLFLRDEQIGAITVSAIKEQQRQIEEQKLLIQQLLQRIEALENE